MPNGADVELARRSVAPDGSIKMEGCVVRGVTHVCQNNGTVTIQPGEAVLWARDSGNLTGRSSLGRWNQGTDERIRPNILRIQRGAGDGTSIGWAGVALDTIKPGESGEVASVGSIVMVNYDASGFLLATGTPVADSATVAGAVAPGGGVTPGDILGHVVISNGVSANDTGSNTQVAIFVNPH